MGAEWEAASYIIKKVRQNIKIDGVSGFPPQDIVSASLEARNGEILYNFTMPGDTVIDGKTVCTMGGVLVVRKEGSAPRTPEDGDIILDYEIKYGSSLNKTTSNAYSGKDTGLKNNVTYYYGFFPYSDHGVCNVRIQNVRFATPSTVQFWTFNQDFISSPSQISYPSGCKNASRSAGETYWTDFLYDVLGLYPYMVSALSANQPGRATEALNKGNYYYKKDGEKSSFYNFNSEIGAFMWMNKVYMREEYSSTGNSREVSFSSYETDGFYAKGFAPNKLGYWIPIGWMCNYNVSCVEYTKTSPYGVGWETPKTAGDSYFPSSSNGYRQDTFIPSNSAVQSNLAYFGGEIVNVLRDIEYMVKKTTNVANTTNYDIGSPVWTNVTTYYHCAPSIGGTIYHQSGQSEVEPTTINQIPNGSLFNYNGIRFGSYALGTTPNFILDPYVILRKIGDRYHICVRPGIDRKVPYLNGGGGVSSETRALPGEFLDTGINWSSNMNDLVEDMGSIFGRQLIASTNPSYTSYIDGGIDNTAATSATYLCARMNFAKAPYSSYTWSLMPYRKFSEGLDNFYGHVVASTAQRPHTYSTLLTIIPPNDYKPNWNTM